MNDSFARLESEVRSYSRSFPCVFRRALGSWLVDEAGREYLDFFAGAGALNYGHNNPVLKRELIKYLLADGVTHGLDMATSAKREFIETFDALVLRPRGLEYKLQFPGPGGANAVEAALKLARKVTGRTRVVGFTGSFHGMTLGALAVTGSAGPRASAHVGLRDATIMPFGAPLHTYGDAPPAAFIVETVQGEGGVHVAQAEWLRALEEHARELGALLIVDDVQAGCGRCGSFFSFEAAGIRPDIVCLSKSLSGFGLPLALTLLRPDIDLWAPGEHNGTFRGLNLAFVTATAALAAYWRTNEFALEVSAKGALVAERLQSIAASCPDLRACVRGRGLMQGLDLGPGATAVSVARRAFENGLLVETSGPGDGVLKILPPLTITASELAVGLDRIEAAVEHVVETTAERLAVA